MKANRWMTFGAGLFMLVLILKPNTVIEGAAEGIDICIKTVIPSLFPFFVISSVLTNSVQGSTAKWLRPFGRLMGIPSGSEPILLLGLCGGYPVGAKSTADAYTSGRLGKKDAQRMLSFCSNAGPSFIFGISTSLFSSKSIPWALWLVQLVSMAMVAMVLPGKSKDICHSSTAVRHNPMEQALKAMAAVCGWIILMRVVITLCNSFLHLSPVLLLVLTGILELSNGCIGLSGVSDPVMAYVMMGLFLSLGGICVVLQTKSLSGDLKIQNYILGKLLQTVFAASLLLVSVPILFPGNVPLLPIFISSTTSVICGLLVKTCAKHFSANKPICP